MAKPPSRRKQTTSALESNSKSPEDSAHEDTSVQKNPATATITVTAVEIPELTEQEQSLRLHLERKVERAVFEAGKALLELRDGLPPRRRRSQSVKMLPKLTFSVELAASLITHCLELFLVPFDY